MLNPRFTTWLTAICFFSFFLFGFTDNLKGPAIPDLLGDLQFTYTQGGTILLYAYVGFLLATLSSGFLIDRIGKKSVLLLAGACLFIGTGTFSILRSFWGLCLAMAVIGFGLGSIEVGSNSLIIALHGERKGKYLNLLAVFHGMGATSAPFYGNLLLGAGLGWQSIYRFNLPIAGLLFLSMLLIPYREKPASTPAPSSSAAGRSLFEALINRRMLFFYLVIVAYVAIELGFASWIVEYLQRERQFSASISGAFLSIFFAAIMVGRFLGSLFVEKMGYLRSLLLAGAASMICLGLAMFGDAAFTFLFPLSGLFLSIIFPTTIAAAVSEDQTTYQGKILGVLFTLTAIGGMLGPWAIGLCSDWWGLAWGFSILLGFCGAMLLALIPLRFGQAKPAVKQPEPPAALPANDV
mgnify:CR=1 FL=1